MQTNLADWIKDTPEGKEADAILRACVHCGFCTATCPTYQLLGDELDGPRGRIYLIKQMLEGAPVSSKTQLHLDRCVTCRSCETTCPSGVRYGRLVDIGRAVVDEKVGRPPMQRLGRSLLNWGLTRRGPFSAALAVGRTFRAVLPAGVAKKIPARIAAGPWPTTVHPRKMLMLNGCVQPALLPRIDAATARVLDCIGITSLQISESACCGAVSHHLDFHDEAIGFVKRNIDAWWPHVEAGAEAIVVNASGCAVMVKDYGHLLRFDAAYADKAARIASLSKDVSEIVTAEWESLVAVIASKRDGAKREGEVQPKLAFHSPCTLQHGQQIRGVVERVLREIGYTLTPVADSHLCCGSAGTYSILHPDLSNRLKANKLAALVAGDPLVIVSANVGCITHLQGGSTRPVRHWIELLDEALHQKELGSDTNSANAASARGHEIGV